VMPLSTPVPADRPLGEVAAAVVDLTAPLFAALARFGDQAAERVDLRRHPAFGEPRAWDALEPVVTALLADHPLVTGAGLATWPPALPAAPSMAPPSMAPPSMAPPSMAWWVRRNGEVRAKHHVLNPRSDSYYDVTQARWFREPYRTGGSTLLAPYVDSWGTDDVTMTAAVPVRSAGIVVGVVAADLDVRTYVDAVERLLATAGATAVLDEEDRVIASTHPRLEAGARLAATNLGPVRSRADVGDLGWAVVRL
jgi:hypothetical protein